MQLDTTYLDERIRISRGASRGTPFVFVATTDRDASLWKSIHDRSPLSAKAVGKVMLAAGALIGATVRSLSIEAFLAAGFIGEEGTGNPTRATDKGGGTSKGRLAGGRHG